MSPPYCSGKGVNDGDGRGAPNVLLRLAKGENFVSPFLNELALGGEREGEALRAKVSGECVCKKRGCSLSDDRNVFEPGCE